MDIELLTVIRQLLDVHPIPSIAFLLLLSLLISYVLSQRRTVQTPLKAGLSSSTTNRLAPSNAARSLLLLILLLGTSLLVWSTCSQHWSNKGFASQESALYFVKHHHTPAGSLPNLFNASISELQAGLELGQYTSVDLVEAYLARIGEVNAVLHAVIETAPIGLLREEARKLDAERSLRGKRGYLHGIPILVKDNVATDVSLGMNTTAGSFALLNSVPPSDAPIITQLRRAGAIIIGKSNMSVWAQARGNNLTQGWSPRGGYTSSAYWPSGNACSSSSGAGVATSVGLAAASIGTETDGSIICPSTRNGIVGLKPSVGLASRFGVVPISFSQDTAGPMAQSVNDAAIILTGMMTPSTKYQGSLDAAVSTQPKKVAKGIDYATNLFDLRMEEKALPLKGVRIGVLGGNILNASMNGVDHQVVDIYFEGLRELEAAGATLVNVSLSITRDRESLYKYKRDRNDIIIAELQYTIDSYLSYLKHIPSGIFNMGGLIDFANSHPELELPEEEADQSVFIETLYSPVFGPIEIDDKNGNQARQFNETYKSGQEDIKRLGTEIRDIFQQTSISALVGPSDSYIYSIAAKLGVPSITVPNSYLRSEGVVPDPANKPIWPFNGSPAGLCFVALKWQEETLLEVARGFEIMQMRAGRGRHDGRVRTYREATPTTQLETILQKKRKTTLI
jgi:amidase